MTYPRNAASPEPIAIGAVVQISDGAVQTSGCTIRIKPIGVAEGDGGGTTAYSTDGVVLYTPTQSETNYTSFVLIAKKTGCIPVAVTVVTSASATAGYVGTDQGKIANATSTVNLSGTTIKAVTDAVTAGTVSDKTGYSLANLTVQASTILATGTHNPQSGDAFSRLGAPAGASVSADISTMLSRLTSSRAGYLDNLNVGGAVASQADVLAINQSASRRVLLATVGQYERPESSSTTYTVECRTFDGDGAQVNADSTPTLTATGIVTGDLSANLSVASNPSTGVYRWTYTVSSTDTLEQVRFDVSATMSTAFTLSVYTQVADFVAATFTTADRTKLEAIHGKLPSKSYLTGSNNSDGDIQLNEATGTLPADSITASAFDESTAFPVVSADSGSTRIARTGADSDTLESLSDQLDAINADTAAILLDTGTDGVVVAAGSKTGYSLASTGLDSIAVTAPSVVATTFPGMVVQLWRRFFKRATKTSTQIKTYADDGTTVVTTQTVSDDGTTETQGAAS